MIWPLETKHLRVSLAHLKQKFMDSARVQSMVGIDHNMDSGAQACVLQLIQVLDLFKIFFYLKFNEYKVYQDEIIV